MSLYKCTKCHHEWEFTGDDVCDWCGAFGRKIGKTWGDGFDKRLMQRRFKICPYCVKFIPESNDMRGECKLENDIEEHEYCEDYEKGGSNGRGYLYNYACVLLNTAFPITDRVG